MGLTGETGYEIKTGEKSCNKKDDSTKDKEATTKVVWTCHEIKAAGDNHQESCTAMWITFEVQEDSRRGGLTTSKTR